MTKPKFFAFLIALLMWTVGVALFGFFNMPKTVLPYAEAHAPGFVFLIADVWGLVPLGILFFILALTPTGRALQRWASGDREVPPDRVPWGTRVGMVATLFMTFGQAWITAALVLQWHRRDLPWVAQAMRGPHWAGLPDPHHLIPRFWVAAGGLLLAWVGNSLPKLLSPFRGGQEPYDWGKMMRTCGWVMTVCGLVTVACSLFVADLRAAMLISAAILMAPAVAILPIWAIYRLGGQPSAAPPRRL